MGEYEGPKVWATILIKENAEKGNPCDVGIPSGVVVKNLLNKGGDARDTGLIPGSGGSAGVGNDNPLQHSCLEIPEEPGRLESKVSQRVRYD